MKNSIVRRAASNPGWLKEILLKLCKDSTIDIPGVTRGLISVGHLVLILIAIALPIIFYLIYRNKSDVKKLKFLRFLSFLIPFLYALDFFFQPFYRQANGDLGSLTTDKLPFHICTLCGVLIPFVYFNRKCRKFRDIVVVWSFIAAAIYIIYPGHVLDDTPVLSYSVLQSFMYHILLILWSMMMFMTRATEFKLKNWWRPIPLLFIEILWASIGNSMYYPTEDFFFLRDDPAWFGLGFLNDLGITWMFIPIMLIAMSSLSALLYVVFALINKKRDAKVGLIDIKNKDLLVYDVAPALPLDDPILNQKEEKKPINKESKESA